MSLYFSFPVALDLTGDPHTRFPQVSSDTVTHPQLSECIDPIVSYWITSSSTELSIAEQVEAFDPARQRLAVDNVPSLVIKLKKSVFER